MRHLWTVIAAIVIAPLAWVLLAFGQDQSARVFAGAQGSAGFDTGDFVGPSLCLAGAGLVLGLIATLRFSPLGAALTGFAYAASYLALLVNPDGLLDLFGGNLSIAGQDADPTTPLRTGTALALGVLLLVGVLSVSRWRQPFRGTSEADLPDDGAPLGADGLGLTNPARSAEPEQVTRHRSRAEPAGRSDPYWTTRPRRA